MSEELKWWKVWQHQQQRIDILLNQQDRLLAMDESLQQRLALKDREIMRLREALERLGGWLEVRNLGGLMPDEKELLSTPATYDDLMAWHETQLGEPVAWKYTRRDGQVTATVNPDFALIVEGDGFEVTQLYAKKG